MRNAMKTLFIPRSLILAMGSAALLPNLASANEGFVEGASAALQARNYYFSRNLSDIVGPNQQSKAEEWAQGFILRINSDYTQRAIGFGVDAINMLDIKLDSGDGRINTDLLPTGNDGKAQNEYSRLGTTLKMHWSQTEFRLGELTPDLPVLTFSDIRLLPP